MEVKQFGIYTNKDFVDIVVEIDKGHPGPNGTIIEGICIPIEEFYELTNECINKSLEDAIFINFGLKNIFSKVFPRDEEEFKNNGYLGQINTSHLQLKLIQIFDKIMYS